ncbi:MAG: aminoglycoside 3'-phosphotransferase [Phenylobacterium sp.]|uniref:aminoglycoside 3'-phosphotransferase n=1 Tax=Phenylobacterium sp. TaxID=1871053 RepID=UPI002722DA40|nr:aminoglycoside 3'-phosphotransferase [Phenylobacterium sp.]MDO9432787.1 aminoglycoside 3'-phosphotransferase [Phenylobacterium sp.]
MSLDLTSPLDANPAIREVLAIAGLSAGAVEIQMISHGQSGDLVAQVGALVVKRAPAERPHNIALLRQEIDVMRWLGERARTPAILWAGACDAGYGLVSEAVNGTPVSHVAEDQARAALIATIGALAALHALPSADCPFDRTLAARFPMAEAQVEAGLVDEDDFDAERAGWTAPQALAHARATAPTSEDLVLTHGDASLPNFIWSPGQAVTLLDLGRFGLANRYQDLAIFLRSAEYNHPHIDARALLREHYPLEQIDETACAFYRLLDEFF